MPTTETDWPYDADRDDPLTKLRIAAVASAHPRWNYIVAFDTSRSQRPTDTEAAMIQSFLCEYIEYWYNERWKARLAERPFDIDGGANGVVFCKWGDGDWGYRRRSWSMGPLYVPQSPRLREIDSSRLGPLDLDRLMDRVHTHGRGEPTTRWLGWKAAHPEVFS